MWRRKSPEVDNDANRITTRWLNNTFEAHAGGKEKIRAERIAYESPGRFDETDIDRSANHFTYSSRRLSGKGVDPMDVIPKSFRSL